jgi:hypothetical protein
MSPEKRIIADNLGRAIFPAAKDTARLRVSLIRAIGAD